MHACTVLYMFMLFMIIIVLSYLYSLPPLILSPLLLFLFSSPFFLFPPLLLLSSPSLSSPLPSLPLLPLPAPPSPSPLPPSPSLQIQELEDEVEELRSRLKETQESLERETLAKVDLQNQIQSLREELAFKKKVYDEV